ncbi:MAG TPA: GT4 family glycosyltransferase PelF [Gaiellaceae bacterium]|nr:GT4 family glycosyltransferase PelF [Gaiellaceae bacterium]
MTDGNARPTALLTTEGTYPYEGGGVSTWCDVLVRELAEFDFAVLAIAGGPTPVLRWELPPNARVAWIPVWEGGDPSLTLEPGLAWTDVRRRARRTTDEEIERRFVPPFRRILRALRDPAEDAGSACHALWRFGRSYHWKTAWLSRPAWRAFADDQAAAAEESDERFMPSVADLTTGMQWLYNLLLPLAAPLPRAGLVHATIASSAVLPGIVAAHEHGTPLVVTDHGVSIRERYLAVSATEMSAYGKRLLIAVGALLSRLAYTHAACVAPVANYNRRWEERYGATPERTRTIYNGVDPNLFVPRPKPESTAGRPTVVAAARVMPVKDVETMIEAAAVARREIPDVRFLVYGATDVDLAYTERCRALVASLGLEDTFVFAGFHARPAELYAEGDISILSSISEGFPYTVLESMACGRPVAATDVGGVREALEGAGIVVPPRDPEALGQAVVRLLREDDLRLALGRRGREEVLARFRTARSVEHYRSLYEELMPA